MTYNQHHVSTSDQLEQQMFHDTGFFSIEDVWKRCGVLEQTGSVYWYLRSIDAIESCRGHLQQIERYLLAQTICQFTLIIITFLLLLVSIRFCQTCRHLVTALSTLSAVTASTTRDNTGEPSGPNNGSANETGGGSHDRQMTPNNNGDLKRYSCSSQTTTMTTGAGAGGGSTGKYQKFSLARPSPAAKLSGSGPSLFHGEQTRLMARRTKTMVNPDYQVPASLATFDPQRTAAQLLPGSRRVSRLGLEEPELSTQLEASVEPLSPQTTTSTFDQHEHTHDNTP